MSDTEKKYPSAPYKVHSIERFAWFVMRDIDSTHAQIIDGPLMLESDADQILAMLAARDAKP